MNTYRWSFQSVRYPQLHARTKSTQLAARTHSATPSTVPNLFYKHNKSLNVSTNQ